MNVALRGLQALSVAGAASIPAAIGVPFAVESRWALAVAGVGSVACLAILSRRFAGRWPVFCASALVAGVLASVLLALAVERLTYFYPPDSLESERRIGGWWLTEKAEQHQARESGEKSIAIIVAEFGDQPDLVFSPGSVRLAGITLDGLLLMLAFAWSLCVGSIPEIWSARMQEESERSSKEAVALEEQPGVSSLNDAQLYETLGPLVEQGGQVNYSMDRIGFVPLKLDGPSQAQLERVILDAFISKEDLGTLVNELNKLPQHFTHDSLRGTVHALVSKARSEGWDGNLLLTARALNPGNIGIQRLAARFFRAPVTLTRDREPMEKVDLGRADGYQALERVVTERLGIMRMEDFLANYTQISRQVCTVEVAVGDARETGTGFLVGPNVVLTNYHVVEGLLAAGGSAASVVCRFDFLRGTKGLAGRAKSLSSTVAFPVAWARPSAVDSDADDGGKTPADDELDYALLQLDSAVADEMILNDGTPRGYIRITDAPSPVTRPDLFANEAALVIAQHPNGHPLSLAIDTQGIIGLNGNGTRLRYRTNTEGGSSGSPCCVMDAGGLTPVALHQAGDPKYAFRYKPKFNQGVPLHLIVGHIRNNFGKSAVLLG